MPGSIALVGAGEFLTQMSEFDLRLLRATGRRRARVAIVPTASFPDGERTFQRWIAMGHDHFRSLGAEVEAVPVRDRAAADDPGHAQAVAEADIVYFSGGRPGYLLDVLEGSAVWDAARRANDRGAILVGCSAGAMVLAGRQLDVRRRVVPVRWRPALGAVEQVAVLPHYDAQPEPVLALVALAAPKGVTVLGVDEDTAVVGREGVWQVHGRGRVTVWRGRHRERHRGGDVFRLVTGAEPEPSGSNGPPRAQGADGSSGHGIPGLADADMGGERAGAEREEADPSVEQRGGSARGRGTD